MIFHLFADVCLIVVLMVLMIAVVMVISAIIASIVEVAVIAIVAVVVVVAIIATIVVAALFVELFLATFEFLVTDDTAIPTIAFKSVSRASAVAAVTSSASSVASRVAVKSIFGVLIAIPFLSFIESHLFICKACSDVFVVGKSVCLLQGYDDHSEFFGDSSG